MPIDRNEMRKLVLLEEAGELPDAYTVAERGGVWSWSYNADGQIRTSAASDRDGAVRGAWGNFWTSVVGKLPPGYGLERKSDGWSWATDAAESISFASEPECRADAWMDWRALLLGKQRATTALPTGVEQIMAMFQQQAFELVTVEQQLKKMQRHRDMLIAQMTMLATKFAEAARKQFGPDVAKLMQTMAQGNDGKGQG